MVEDSSLSLLDYIFSIGFFALLILIWINNPYFTSIFQTIISIPCIAQGIIDYKNIKETQHQKEKKKIISMLFHLGLGICLLLAGLQKITL